MTAIVQWHMLQTDGAFPTQLAFGRRSIRAIWVDLVHDSSSNGVQVSAAEGEVVDVGLNMEPSTVPFHTH
jgi:hypothetical protein